MSNPSVSSVYGGFVRGTFECAGFGMVTGLLTRIKAATFVRLAASIGRPDGDRPDDPSNP
ncbi:hypothetical protein PSCICO_41550 [Pseudomonas cichorii]|nr:hypothetical protein PSCICO_41550 [Pseudomonas cichorii]